MIDISDKTIIVTKSCVKNDLLLYASKNLDIIDCKIMTKKELLEDITFSYAPDVLQYMTKYNKTISICKTILDNLYYVDDIDGIKEDLISNKKIIYSESIITKYKKIYFYDIDIDPFFYKKIKKINKNIEIIEEKSSTNSGNKVFVFNTDDISDEVLFLFDKWYELINKGIDINKIKLVIPDDEYNTYLEYYSELFGINVNLNTRKSIYSYGIALKILERYKNGESLFDIIKSIEPTNNKIIERIVNIINKYDWNKDIYDLLVYEFKNNYINDEKYSNSIEVFSIDDITIKDDEYLFIAGFNQNLIPHINRDDDYFKDDKKELIGLFTSTQKNKLSKQEIIKLVNSSKETYISYKLKTPFNIYTKSSLLENFEFDEYNYEHDYAISPSKMFDKYLLNSMVDDAYKYGIKNESLEILLSNVENDYGTYNNKFKGIEINTLNKLLKDEIKLSYTSINSYYECAYKYYLKYLLKIKEDSSNIDSLFLGNLFHYVLSEVFNESKTIKELINEFVKEKQLNVKDKLYLKKYERELELLIDVINENRNRSHFKDLYYEKEINITSTNKIKVTLTGKIDKILSFDDGINNYVIIIDYKTGNLKVEYNNIVFGLNMQLFIYAYLLKNGGILPNPEIAGFYLQNIGHDLLKKQEGKTNNELIKNEYKLYGYSKENIDIIEKFDNDFSSLKNLKVKTDGTFYSNSLVFSDELLKKFLDIVEDKVNEASANIISGNYEINPKELNDKNISCEYCKYFDICYRKNRDVNVLKQLDIDDYVKAGK